MKKLLFILLSAFASMQAPAFSLYNKERLATLQQTTHAYDQNQQTVATAVEGEKTPAPIITVSGTNNTVTSTTTGNPAYTAKVEAKAAAAGNVDNALATSDAFKKNLPWGIAGILFAIAIIAVIKAIQYARSVSPAVDAAVGVADNGMAKLITRIEGHAAVETDPRTSSLLNSLLSDANKQRGTVKAHTNKKRKVK